MGWCTSKFQIPQQKLNVDDDFKRYISRIEAESGPKTAELQRLLSLTQQHIASRLAEGWTRGYNNSFRSSVNKMKINAINYICGDDYPGVSDPISGKAPEENDLMIDRAQKQIRKFKQRIDVARRGGANKIDLRLDPPKVRKINEVLKKRGIAARARVDRTLIADGLQQRKLTISEVEMLIALLEDGIAEIRAQKDRKWGLCRDWANSIHRRLGYAGFEHYLVEPKQYSKRDLLGVNQHNIVRVTENEGLDQTKAFVFIIDAWIHPTLFQGKTAG